jgi:hypothetical protein
MIFNITEHRFSAAGGKSIFGFDLTLCAGGIGEFCEAADFSGGSSFVYDAFF